MHALPCTASAMKNQKLRSPRICLQFGLWASLLLFGCGHDRFEIRTQADKCVESTFAVHTEVDRVEGKGNSSPLSLADLQALAVRPANLELALAKRKYIVHYYQRTQDHDVEINPAKFPLFWDIDSTVIQTEGIFLVHFKDERTANISFKCEGCIRIDTTGQTLEPKHAALESELEAAIPSKQCSPEWCFSLRPRKIQLKEEVGQDYLVRIESRKSYLATAKDRIQVEDGKGYPGTFTIRFRDPLEYRATNFLKELGIAMALSDKEDRAAEIAPRLETLEQQISELKREIDSLQLSRNEAGNKPTNVDEASQQLEHEKMQTLTALEREKEHLLLEKFAVLPRLLVTSPALPCRQ